MRNFMVVLAIALCGALVLPKQSVAQDATIQKVWGDDTPSETKITFFVMTEAVTAAEMPEKITFIKAVIDSSFGFKQMAAISEISDVYLVAWPSKDSGISDSTRGITHNTNLGLFSRNGSPYEIPYGGLQKLVELRKKLLPNYNPLKDQTVIMANDPGGNTSSGTGPYLDDENSVSVIRVDVRFVKSCVVAFKHEVFGIGLGWNYDEDTRWTAYDLKYNGPRPFVGPNLTMETDINLTPWGPFKNVPGVGMVKGGAGLGPNSGLSHAQEFCLMGTLTPSYPSQPDTTQFCVACMQSIYLQAMKRVGLVRSYYPNSPADMPDSGTVFYVLPNAVTLSVRWTLNGDLWATGPTCRVLPDSLAAGVYTLVASMKDTAGIAPKGYEMYGNDPAGFHYGPDGKLIPYIVKIDPNVILKGSLTWQITVSEQVAGKSTDPAAASDFNGDGMVNFEDFFLFTQAFGKSPTGDNAKFDLNKDGRIGLEDFFLFVDAFGKKVSLKKTR